MKFEGNLQGQEYQPRAARIDVKFDAFVHFDCGAVAAVILNVSSDGFRLHTAEQLEAGTQVTLAVDKLEPVKGLIRWVRGQESGGVFLEAVAL